MPGSVDPFVVGLLAGVLVGVGLLAWLTVRMEADAAAARNPSDAEMDEIRRTRTPGEWR